MTLGYLIGVILMGGLTVQSWGSHPLLEVAPPVHKQIVEVKQADGTLGASYECIIQCTVRPQQ